MTRCLPLILILVCGLGIALQALHADGLRRTWTSTDGKTVEMELVASDGKTGTFLLGTRKVEMPLDRLTEEDQSLAREWAEKAATTSTTASPQTPKSREWPEVIEVKSSEIEITEQGEKDGFHIYETAHFRFRSQEKLGLSLMKEVARVFESSHALVVSMPWAMTPKPPGQRDSESEPSTLFEAELYRDRSAYTAAGGPKLSGGVYIFGYRGAEHYGKFMVPFENIGVKKVGKSFMKNSNFTADTLIHELAHQLMHYSLFLIPKWASEGSAEYCESIPYKVGRFRVEAIKTGIKDSLERSGKPALPNDILSFLTMDRNTWEKNASTAESTRRLYQQSLLCFYFFSHLEGEGNGENLLGYFDKIHEAQNRWAEYIDAYQVYKKELDTFLEKPGVKKLPDGRFTFPGDMTPPASPKNPFPNGVESISTELVDELIDGRSSEELREEMVEGYRSIGVRLR